MGFEEVAIICTSVTACVGIVATAYYFSELKKEQMRQYGITSRQQMKMGTGSETTSTQQQGGEWWTPFALELLKNPQVQNMILQKVAPALQQTTSE